MCTAILLCAAYFTLSVKTQTVTCSAAAKKEHLASEWASQVLHAPALVFLPAGQLCKVIQGVAACVENLSLLAIYMGLLHLCKVFLS